MADLKTIQEDMRERLREIESLIEALRGEAQQIKKMLGGLWMARRSSAPSGPVGLPAGRHQGTATRRRR